MTQSILLEGETLSEGAGFPCLTYYRAGSGDKPLVVFVPGGGHLARVSYGHGGANRHHFLDYWLEKHEYGLLAVSYPSDYPVFERLYSEMSVSDWGNSLASAVANVITENGLSPRIVMLGWSMAGKVAGRFARAAHSLGLEVACFISLAATSALPGLMPRSGGPLTPQGLWDSEGMGRSVAWADEIEAIGKAEDQPIISRDGYGCFYRCNNPIQLRGEVERLQGGVRVNSLESAVDDVGSFDYAHFPICASITPTSPSDARHVLTDSISWSFYTVSAIWFGMLSGVDVHAMSQAAWSELRALMDSIPQRLTRHVPGGHFFFIGKTGASETARHVDDLIREAARLEEALQLFK
jgi:pimeloyl-ACP methyl ester carboxylesterase